MLLEHGAVDGLPEVHGRTPADLARSNGHAAVAKVLNEGATLKVETPRSHHSVHSASRMNSTSAGGRAAAHHL